MDSKTLSPAQTLQLNSHMFVYKWFIRSTDIRTFNMHMIERVLTTIYYVSGTTFIQQ